MPAPSPRAAPASEFAIRRAGPRDLDAIDAIETRSFIADRFPRRNLKRALASPAALTLLVAENGAPAGYVMLLFRAGARVARLYSIAVDPACRGRGLAERLINEAVGAAKARGADRLRLEVRPSNTAAQRLYERAGFAHLSRIAGYYADGEDAIRMERRLAPKASGDRSAQP